jgi:aspartyl/asparaginyl beta-hydroxylase (cupin superfamily)
VLQEAFRTVTVREGEKTLTLPAIQAVIRSAIALAAKGNGPAQRAFIDMMRALEQETNKAAEQQPPVETAPMTDLDKARRIAFILSRGQRELERRQTKAA